MLDLDFCKQILGAQSPWLVLKVAIDQTSKRLDIHMGFAGVVKRNMFGFLFNKGGTEATGRMTCPHCHAILPAKNEIKSVCIRHLPIAGFATYLHIPEPGTVQSSRSDCICMHPWIKTGTHCTTEMSDYLIAMMQSVSNTRAIAQLTGISAEELGEIAALAKIEPEAVADETGDLSQPGKVAGSGIPGLKHPAWRSLINSSLSLQSNNVALNMLLKRVRMNYDKSPDNETTKAGALQLRQFFVRNERILTQEIAQVFDSQPMVATAKESVQQDAPQNVPAKSSVKDATIPNLDHPVWQRIIKGDQAIQSDKVAFNMLLKQARVSYDKAPGSDSVTTGTKSLHHFFVRHQKFLRQEIDQLNNYLSDAVIEGDSRTERTGDDSLPAESAAVWRQIVNGERQFETNMVGLQMILERARKSLMQDSSEDNRRASVRTLYDFFIKHKRRLSREIAQLEDGINN